MGQPVGIYKTTVAQMWANIFAPPGPVMRDLLESTPRVDTSALALMADGKVTRRPIGYANITMVGADGKHHRERLAIYSDGPASESLLKTASKFTLHSIEPA